MTVMAVAHPVWQYKYERRGQSFATCISRRTGRKRDEGWVGPLALYITYLGGGDFEPSSVLLRELKV